MSVGSEFKRKVNLGYNYKGDTNPFEYIVFFAYDNSSHLCFIYFI